MNKTVQSILSLTAFSLLLIIITLFCGGLGFARLLEIQGGMEYGFLAILMALDLMIIYKFTNYISFSLKLSYYCLDWKVAPYCCGLSLSV